MILLEGNKDKANFSAYNSEYTFIDCGGAGGIRNFLTCLKTIPFLKEISDKKLIICLYDFDTTGKEELSKTLMQAKDGIQNYQVLVDRINNKHDCFVAYKKHNAVNKAHIYLSLLKPNPENDWSGNFSYRHQELKHDGNNGLERQIKSIEVIKEELSPSTAIIPFHLHPIIPVSLGLV